MEEARVSILVTFYNQEAYVDQAMNSILSQNCDFGIKIIVGDDGSSDNTCDEVKKWINKYPNVIELHVMERENHKYISGFRASANRINLLKYVTTEYFIFLDGDDYWNYSDKLQKQINILDEMCNQDCVACGHDIELIFADGKRQVSTNGGKKEGKYSLAEYWKDMYIHTDTILIRSTVISSIDFELVEHNFNDIFITFSALQCGMIYYMPVSWAVYCQTGDGIWTSGKQVINLLRNMLIYDLCCQINSRVISATDYRFMSVWQDLYRLRKAIDKSELFMLEEEAIKHNLLNTLEWINYRELSNGRKIRLILKKSKICDKNNIKSKLRCVRDKIFKR